MSVFILYTKHNDALSLSKTNLLYCNAIWGVKFTTRAIYIDVQHEMGLS